MVSSRAYPDLDRSPKKNWVEKSGGLPDYIERVAKHIHYEGGKDISRAIAMAISQVRKWAAQGKAEAAKAIAQWEALKAKNKARTAVKLSAARIRGDVVELSIVEDKTGRVPGPSRSERIAKLRAKIKAGTAMPADRARLQKLLASRPKKVATELGRGPYRRHVAHTKQFGRKKGDLSKRASWQHPYVPQTQVAGAIKAKHIARADVDESGHPKRGKSDEVRKPLPASAAIGGEGRKEQRTGAEAAAQAKSNEPKGKAGKKAPAEATTTLRDRRNALERKKAAGTLTAKESQELNHLVTKLKKAS